MPKAMARAGLILTLVALGPLPAHGERCTSYREDWPVASRRLVSRYYDKAFDSWHSEDAILATATVPLSANCRFALGADAKATRIRTQFKDLFFTYIQCAGEGQRSWVGTAQNAASDQGFVNNRHNLIFEPAKTGIYVCTFHAKLYAKGRSSTDSVVVAPTTYDVSDHISGGSYMYLKPASASAGQADTPTIWVRPGDPTRDAATLTYSPSAGAETFHAFAEVQLTNCYDQSQECAGIGPKTPNFLSAFVTTQIIVVQLSASGAPCRIEEGPAVHDTISRNTHHFKRHVSMIGRYYTTCVDDTETPTDTFHVFSRVTWDGGNPVAVEGTRSRNAIPYTLSIAFEP